MPLFYAVLFHMLQIVNIIKRIFDKELKFIKNHVDSMCVTNNPRRKITMDNNVSRIGASFYVPEYKVGENKEEQKNPKKENQTEEKQEKQLSSNEVFGFMAAQNADLIPVNAPKTLDPAKYITSESEARISDFMEDFESAYDKAYAIAKEEFPDASDKLLSDLALSYMNALYS